MKIVVIGAGPAGLTFASAIRRMRPDANVKVIEQNPQGATFGFGVVFSDRALDFLESDDPALHAALLPHLESWQDLRLAHKGKSITIDGIGFSAIARLTLLDILSSEAAASGADVQWGRRIDDLAQAADADLVVGADGVNSLVRQSDPEGFGASVSYLSNRFAWYGVEMAYPTLTQTFLEGPAGPMTAHHYRYRPDMSTFIVELNKTVWQRSGLADMSEADQRAWCAAAFRDTLCGRPLIGNRSLWRRFPVVHNERFFTGNRVLLGDALHTAHFSIGSGTRLAMEDALSLARNIAAHGTEIAAGLQAFKAERRPLLDKLVGAARASAAWYEAFGASMALCPRDFALSYIQRSGRIDPARLRAMAPRFMAAIEAEPT
jgi:2-polyprenyl-6-methoxyphenol hydroxylase-like FAD-dependent oxidoreductase